MSEPSQNNDRRDFLKKTAYVAPVVMTMQVAPSIASAGSGLTSTTEPTQEDVYNVAVEYCKANPDNSLCKLLGLS